jgi:hypothetical protein
MKMSLRLIVAVALTCSTVLLADAGGAKADTMTCQNSFGSSYCTLGSTGNYGSVTVTGLGTNTADITFTLAVGTIADPNDASVVFDIKGATSASIISGSGWGPVIVNGHEQIDADEFGDAAFGVFPDGASCNNFLGCGTSVEFQVKGTDLQLASVDGFFAAIDTQSTGEQCGFFGCYPVTENGAVADSLPSTPIPAAFPLFAGGLGMIGLIGRRRKRKAEPLFV